MDCGENTPAGRSFAKWELAARQCPAKRASFGAILMKLRDVSDVSMTDGLRAYRARAVRSVWTGHVKSLRNV